MPDTDSGYVVMKKKYFSVLLVLLVFMYIGCTKTDSDTGDADNGQHGINTNTPSDTTQVVVGNDCIATTEVKQLTIALGCTERTKNVFYQDYNSRCRFFLYNGGLCITRAVRDEGRYSENSASYQAVCGIHCMNQAIYSISQIDTKDVYAGENLYPEGYTSCARVGFYDFDYNGSYTYMYYISSNFQPNYGYQILFPTENGDAYMRVFATGYTLDGTGALSSITIQYQLY